MPLETYSVMRADLWWRVTPLLLGFAMSTGILALLGRTLARRSRRPGVRTLGMSGTAEMEFALAFPTFVACLMVTAQMALMINAMLIVDYAAFCAARSAAVWLPQTRGGEAANTIERHEDSSSKADSDKWSRIHGAAALAVVPISPRITRFRFGLGVRTPPRTLSPDYLRSVAGAADAQIRGGASLAQVARAVVDKWPYAYFFTNVDLLNEKGEIASSFSGTVTTRVTHKFEMAVPFAGPLFGSVFGERYIPLIGGYYVPLSASYTLALAQ